MRRQWKRAMELKLAMKPWGSDPHPSLADPVAWADAHRHAMRIVLTRVTHQWELNMVLMPLAEHLYYTSK